MRRIVDADGERWDVVVGRESWGAFFALFIPSGDPARGVRQTPLASETADAAERWVNESTESRLLELLRRSEPKEPKEPI